MKRSEQIGELVTALAKAQSEFTAAVKDSDNPYYASKYADLNAVINAVRPALNKNGIAMMHNLESDLERQVAIVTVGLYCGEQFMEIEVEAPATGRAKKNEQQDGLGPTKFDVQTIGAAWTYLRRYSLQAICGLASEDDDGNTLQNNNKPIARRTTPAQAMAHQNRSAQPDFEPDLPSEVQTSHQSAAQPQAGVLKFIPPNGLTSTIKAVKEIVGIDAKPAKGDIPAMKGVRPRLIVTLLGQHNGVSEASCFDTKLWPAIKESVGLECHFQIAEKDSGGKHYINIEDLVYVAGEEYKDGKPVVIGEK
jgi:hypothetical protein